MTGLIRALKDTLISSGDHTQRERMAAEIKQQFDKTILEIQEHREKNSWLIRWNRNTLITNNF